MTTIARLEFQPVEGAASLFTPEFVGYLVALHDRFQPRVLALRARRAEMLTNALRHGRPPGPAPRSEANSGDWRVPRPTR